MTINRLESDSALIFELERLAGNVRQPLDRLPAASGDHIIIRVNNMTRIYCGLLAALLVSGVASASTTDVSNAYRQRDQHMVAVPVEYRADVYPVQTTFNRFIVKYRDGSSASRSSVALLQSVNGAAARTGLAQTSAPGARSRPVSLHQIRKMAVGSDVLRTSRLLTPGEAEAFLRELRTDPAVVYAQPDYIKYKQDVVPNDTHFADLQWDLTNPIAGLSAPTAWETSTGQGVVVAVLDTGYVDHRDLSANIVPGYDFVSWYGQMQDGVTYPDVAGDGDGRDADAHDPGDWLDGTESFCGGEVSNSSFHGTHVAGTVAALTNNAYGIAGIANAAKVQPVRVLGHCGGLTSDIADGIVWASGGSVPGVPTNATPAEVLNMSLGGFGRCHDDPVTQDAINAALSRGTTVVVAAGNANINAAQFSPASCSGVISVGASGVDGAKSYYSNYGQVVTLAAPGGNAHSSADGDSSWIWSLSNISDKAPLASPAGDVLRGMIGTSMAAPHVAAVVALMQSASVAGGHAAMTPALVKAVLKATVKPFSIVPPSTTPLGTGIVDAAAAVTAAAMGIREEGLAVPLTNRMALSGQSVGAGEAVFYRLTLRRGTRNVSVRTYGGSGDVSLYVSRDQVPTPSSYALASMRPGTTEALVISNPAAGIYYVRVQGVTSATGFSVLAAY